MNEAELMEQIKEGPLPLVQALLKLESDLKELQAIVQSESGGLALLKTHESTHHAHAKGLCEDASCLPCQSQKSFLTRRLVQETHRQVFEDLNLVARQLGMINEANRLAEGYSELQRSRNMKVEVEVGT